MDLDKNAKKALLVFSIENVLLRIGKPSYELVLSRLEKNYNCCVPDCLEKPEYLKRVLQDIYGDAYDEILAEIKNELGELAQQKYYTDFLEAIAEKH